MIALCEFRIFMTKSEDGRSRFELPVDTPINGSYDSPNKRARDSLWNLDAVQIQFALRTHVNETKTGSPLKFIVRRMYPSFRFESVERPK